MDNPVNQSKLEVNTWSRREARENVRERGFGFTSDWSRKWREFVMPINKRSNKKPKAKANYFRNSSENHTMGWIFYNTSHYFQHWRALLICKGIFVFQNSSLWIQSACPSMQSLLRFDRWHVLRGASCFYRDHVTECDDSALVRDHCVRRL